MRAHVKRHTLGSVDINSLNLRVHCMHTYALITALCHNVDLDICLHGHTNNPKLLFHLQTINKRCSKYKPFLSTNAKYKLF